MTLKLKGTYMKKDWRNIAMPSLRDLSISFKEMLKESKRYYISATVALIIVIIITQIFAKPIVGIVSTIAAVLALAAFIKTYWDHYSNRYQVSVGIGVSNVEGAENAGDAAAKEALGKCKKNPVFGLVFASDKYDMAGVARGVDKVLKEKSIHWIGCSSLDGITSDGLVTSSVICTVIGSDYMTFGVGSCGNLRETPKEAGEIAFLQAENKALKKGKGLHYRTLIMFPSGIIKSAEKSCVECYVLDGILDKHKLNNWNIVGASAADSGMMENNWQLIDGKAYQNAIVCGILCSDVKINVGLGMGYRETDKSVIITRCDGNKIFELDGENAIKRYAEVIGIPQEELLANPLGALTEYSLGIIDRRSKLCWCLAPIYIVNDYIKVTGYVHPGQELKILRAGRENLMEGCAAAEDSATADLKPKDIAAVFLFPCAIYRLKFDPNECSDHIRQLAKRLGNDVPIVGFYTFGEQGRSNMGTCGQLNLAVLAMAITQNSK